jgi:hypothetical protein
MRQLRRGVIGTCALGGLGWFVVSAPLATAAPLTVALWHMEDTGSTMHDSSGQGNNGTLTSVTVAQPGFSGYGFGFARNPALVSVRSASTLNPGSSPFTVTAHVRFTKLPTNSTGEDYDLIRKGLASTSGGDWKQEIAENGRASCTSKGSSGSLTLTAGPVLNDGNWHTVTCAFTTGGIKVLVDQSQVASKSAKIGSISNSAALTLGAKSIKSTTSGDQYTGIMDEVSITKG